MKKAILIGIMSLLSFVNAFAVDSGGNSVYIDQTTADNSNVSITQTGSGNQVGDRTNLITPAFVIDGNAMNLTIVQTGMNNSIVGNFIGGDSTANITQEGSGNSFALTQGNFGTSSGLLNITKTGDNNTVALNMGITSNAGNYNYSLTISGNTNNITSTINSKYTQNTMTITGSTNTVTTTQVGFNGNQSTPGHNVALSIIGNSNSVAILQNGTTFANAITLNISGSNTTTAITQH